MATPNDMIDQALQEIGVTAIGSAADTADRTFGLAKLNQLLDQWNTNKNAVVYLKHEIIVFGVSTPSYQIGPGAPGNFSTDRPIIIDYANYIPAGSDTSTPLRINHVKDYASLGRTPSAGTPIQVYYQASWPYGTLWFDPYPSDVAAKVELFSRKQFANIAGGAASTDYSLPPGYLKAIVLGLAIDLSQPYGKELSQTLLRNYNEAIASAFSVNSTVPRLNLSDIGLGDSGGSWDFTTGNFR